MAIVRVFKTGFAGRLAARAALRKKSLSKEGGRNISVLGLDDPMRRRHRRLRKGIYQSAYGSLEDLNSKFRLRLFAYKRTFFKKVPYSEILPIIIQIYFLVGRQLAPFWIRRLKLKWRFWNILCGNATKAVRPLFSSTVNARSQTLRKTRVDTGLLKKSWEVKFFISNLQYRGFSRTAQLGLGYGILYLNGYFTNDPLIAEFDVKNTAGYGRFTTTVTGKDWKQESFSPNKFGNTYGFGIF